MKFFIFIFTLLSFYRADAQTFDSLITNSHSILKSLKSGDSVVYYQCHVEESSEFLASDNPSPNRVKKYTVTDKFVVTRLPNALQVNHYASPLKVFPNRKFSGLKIRERPYWAFKKQGSFLLTEKAVKILIALERKGREAIEYDFAITKHNTNQLIIKHQKDFKQLVIDGNYTLSELMQSN
jgi:hypothetical protein